MVHWIGSANSKWTRSQGLAGQDQGLRGATTGARFTNWQALQLWASLSMALSEHGHHMYM